jgi:hypothetical protein
VPSSDRPENESRHQDLRIGGDERQAFDNRGRSDVAIGSGWSFPCLVMSTGCDLTRTSSMMARQSALKTPAGIVFSRF